MIISIPTPFLVIPAALIVLVLAYLITGILNTKRECKALKERFDTNNRAYKTALDDCGRTFETLAKLAPNLYAILGLEYSEQFGYKMYKAWDANLIEKVWASSDKDNYRKLAKRLREEKF